MAIYTQKIHVGTEKDYLVSMDTFEPLVYIIVITFNGEHHLRMCLPSLQKTNYSNYQVVLVDNASEDGSFEYVRSNFPVVKVVRNPANYGFAKGNNIAMRMAVSEGAKYVLLLNDDTIILDPNWLQQAVAVAERDPMIGMVGFELTADASKSAPSDLVVKAVERISGCALLIRSDVLKRLGYFDEVYFAYAEESDLEMRAMKAGYRLKQINMPVYHKGKGSFSKFPIAFAFLFIRNWIRFSIKNESLGKALLRPLIVFDLLCNPFPIRRRDIDFALHSKINTGSRGLNLMLLIGAVLWNTVFLPQTLFIRLQEQRRVRSARKMLLG